MQMDMILDIVTCFLYLATIISVGRQVKATFGVLQNIMDLFVQYRVHPFICPSVNPSIHQSIQPFIQPSFYPFIRPSVQDAKH